MTVKVRKGRGHQLGTAYYESTFVRVRRVGELTTGWVGIKLILEAEILNYTEMALAWPCSQWFY